MASLDLKLKPPDLGSKVVFPLYSSTSWVCFHKVKLTWFPSISITARWNNRQASVSTILGDRKRSLENLRSIS